MWVREMIKAEMSFSRHPLVHSRHRSEMLVDSEGYRNRVIIIPRHWECVTIRNSSSELDQDLSALPGARDYTLFFALEPKSKEPYAPDKGQYINCEHGIFIGENTTVSRA